MIWATIGVEAVGFVVVILFTWGDELFDLPRHIFGLDATPFNWADAVIESVYIFILATAIITVTWLLIRRIKYLEGMIPVCMVCGKVHSGEKWVPIDTYIRNHSEADVSHGLCDECAKKRYGFDPEGEDLPHS